MRSITISICIIVFSIFFLIADEASCSDSQEFKFTTGFDYSSGDYGGNSDTTILYIPFTGKYLDEKYSIKVTIPYLRIKSEDTVVTSGGQVIVSGDSLLTSEETESGLGDIVAAFSYYLLEETENSPMVDINAKVKLGTADEDKGLGTGETDYALEVDLAKTFDENVLFGTLGYKFYGDPAAYDLDNAFYTSIGLSHRFSSELSAGLMHDYREKTTDSGSEMNELTACATCRLSSNYKLMGYTVAGLSDGSPDWGIGLTITRAFGAEDISKSYRYLEKLRFW